MEQYPVGGMSLYCASKAFVHHFAIALGIELQHDTQMQGGGIDHLLYSPGFVSTKLNKCPYVPVVIPRPYEAAWQALADAGKYPVTYGTLAHAVMAVGF